MATPFSFLSSMSPPSCSEPVPLTVSPAETTLNFVESVDGLPVKTETTTTSSSSSSSSTSTTTTPKPEEKKPVKKRKSWGQELPTPKTNLPPRKRAKTEDEKEQRRIERVLRNRAAAQTSRERKRLEVEKLEGEKLQMERQNELLLRRLAQMEAENNRLSQQVAHLSAEIRSSRGSSPQSIISGIPSPTLAPVLFKQERDEMISNLDKIPFPTPSLSAYSPSVKGCDLTDPSDLTQHPAAMLCDLQCQSEASSTRSVARLPHPQQAREQQQQRRQQNPQVSPNLSSTPALMTSSSSLHPSQQPLHPPHQQQHQQLLFNLALLSIIQHLFQTMTSTVCSTLRAPLTQIFRSLKQGSPLTFSPAEIHQHLPLILWLISTPNLLTSVTTTTKTTKTKTTTTTHLPLHPPVPTNRPVFRIQLLTRLLACSPALARPLRDATSKALQLVASGEAMGFGSLVSSSGSVGSDRGSGVGVGVSPSSSCPGSGSGAGSRGYELLLTVIWAIDCIERAKAKAKTKAKMVNWKGKSKSMSLTVRRRRTLESRTRLSRGDRAWIKFQASLGGNRSRSSNNPGSGPRSRSGTRRRREG
ncbi:hypothetical protein AJ78_08145 [Emergomyces pasteurianus Ep9510]|uniref:BZIP domain-containing protein n=1 Tax=Emergomyces pasteurianus Ep9510 TaxID=1447872 RepID=A0A1J9Q408_9EURO|nr:hypothetical protein AJ78_08145 [Emergomyces pasteurianus Ep9510]